MRQARQTGMMLWLAAAAALPACTMPMTQQANRGAVVEDPASTDKKSRPSAKAGHAVDRDAKSAGDQDIEALTRSVQEQADRVRAAMATNTDSSAQPTAGGDSKPARTVEWIDQRPAPRKPVASAAPGAKPVADRVALAPAPVQPAPTDVALKHPATQPAPVDAATVKPVKPAIAVAPAPLDRRTLTEQFAHLIRSGEEPLLAKVMASASLASLDPNREIDATLLENLNPEQREQVVRYHAFMRDLGRRTATGEAVMDIDGLRERVEEHAAAQPVRIRSVQLCRRVTGFGVYEPFETTSFLAGKENPVIVYVEVDNFRTAKIANDQYEVRLQQEVTLFNEADGLAVWRQPSVEVVDQSRNRRRDFFVVQLIKLPPRLTVGKYRLKVRVTDPGGSNGGSLFEASVPLQVVADQALAKSEKK